jgi:hypothetical protein
MNTLHCGHKIAARHTKPLNRKRTELVYIRVRRADKKAR